jgi:ubiquinone/menaquinone biosynthesis C-methylase UbiE
MTGRVLFEAVGTGLDIPCFPPGLDIIAIDISKKMLGKAERRRASYDGNLELVQADAMELPFADDSFDTVATSCTFCSIPDPVRALRQSYRVVRPAGRLLMFEHVRSRNPVFGLTLDLMTLWARRLGSEMNRDTVGNLVRAGFHVEQINSVYLDIILAIYARKPCTS